MEDRTSSRAIEDKVRALGYTPVSGAVPETRTSHRQREPWWRHTKGRLVLSVGALFVLAFVLASILPEWERWLYSAAALISAVPFVRRALAGALSGSPFSIETLMTIAALGAVAIGEAEEAAVVIFLFAVGELLETVAAGRAQAGIEALIKSRPANGTTTAQ